MKAKRVYISGPVSGHPIHDVRLRFVAAKRTLESAGCEAVNPMELQESEGDTWADFMLRDLAELRRCDAIFMLDGWQASRGARIEREFAIGAGLDVLHIAHMG